MCERCCCMSCIRRQPVTQNSFHNKRSRKKPWWSNRPNEKSIDQWAERCVCALHTAQSVWMDAIGSCETREDLYSTIKRRDLVNEHTNYSCNNCCKRLICCECNCISSVTVSIVFDCFCCRVLVSCQTDFLLIFYPLECFFCWFFHVDTDMQQKTKLMKNVIAIYSLHIVSMFST